MYCFMNRRTDVLPENMAYALDEIKQYNAMPVYGKYKISRKFSNNKQDVLLDTIY